MTPRRAFPTGFRWAAAWLAVCLLAGLAAPVWAKTPALPTSLLLLDVGPQEVARNFTVMAVLTDSRGGVVSNQSVVISALLPASQDSSGLPSVAVEAEQVNLGQAMTNEQGMAIISVSRDLRAGRYVLQASFRGNHAYEGSQSTRVLTILPGKVTVQTIPALEGVPFRLDQHIVLTGPDGKAVFDVPATGIYMLELLEEKIFSTGQRAEFSRWLEENYKPVREIRYPGETAVQIGFDVYRRARFAYLDLDGQPVDPARVTSLIVKNIQGESFEFTGTGPYWLPAGRIARRMNGLETTELQYSVMRVGVDGSNVVNQAQQKFFLDNEEQWDVTLLLYHLDVRAVDAVFGTPLGSGVTLEYPNGSKVEYPLNPQGMVSVPSLARGIYTVQVTGVKGISSRAPVALSQNQQVLMKVISTADILLAAGAAILLAVGLLLAGRPWLIPGYRRKKPVLFPEEVLEHGSLRPHEN